MTNASADQAGIQDVVLLRSEFAVVQVSVDRSANGDRLRIQDLRSGRVFHLDPLELERLTTIRHQDLTYVVSPARGEWFNGTDLLSAPDPRLNGPTPAGS